MRQRGPPLVTLLCDGRLLDLLLLLVVEGTQRVLRRRPAEAIRGPQGLSRGGGRGEAAGGGACGTVEGSLGLVL